MIKGRRRRSRTLDAGERREIGRYEVELRAGFPGLGTGSIIAFFQIEGRLACLTDRLKISVRYLMARRPKCFKWTIEISSGPNADEFLALFITF